MQRALVAIYKTFTVKAKSSGAQSGAQKQKQESVCLKTQHTGTVLHYQITLVSAAASQRNHTYSAVLHSA